MRAVSVLGLSLLCFAVACRQESASSSVPGDGGGGGGQGGPEGPPQPWVPGAVAAGRQVNHLHAADQARKLDLLFMVDNSASMAEEQAKLARNFPALIRELEALPGGLPDLHIAVISSDVGAGPTAKESCRPSGDAGKFLVKPGCGLDASQAAFLAADGRGNKNFTGELATVLGCLVNLGVTGCAYEHQLQAIRAALADLHPENRGFLRQDAHLGIVLLTDEDDCSAEPDATIFDAARPGEALSFRCNLLGHLCNGQALPAEPFSAPLSSCQAYERNAADRTTRLINVSEFVAFIKQLKPGQPDRIFVSAVTGWDSGPNAQYRTTLTRGELGVEPICSSSSGTASPALRLEAFADAFGANGSVHAICNEDLRPAIGAIGRALAFKLGNTCLDTALLDTDPARDGLQAECQVADRIPGSDGVGFTDQPVPACAGGQMPCWELAADPSCQTGHRLRVNRAAPAPPGTLIASSCRGGDAPPHSCGGAPCAVPPVLAGPGEMCDINMPPPLPANHALWRGDDRVCASQLCVRPAQDPLAARTVDTAALCTATCAKDSDCAGAAMRNHGNQLDKRCARGFRCGVAFETGPLACRKLCLCSDFQPVPTEPPRTPASCAARP